MPTSSSADADPELPVPDFHRMGGQSAAGRVADRLPGAYVKSTLVQPALDHSLRTGPAPLLPQGSAQVGALVVDGEELLPLTEHRNRLAMTSFLGRDDNRMPLRNVFGSPHIHKIHEFSVTAQRG